MSTESEVKQLLADVLHLGERGRGLGRDSALLGSLPEFDSMAVVSVLTAIEERFGIAIEDDEVDQSLFRTVGTLTDFVAGKVP